MAKIGVVAIGRNEGERLQRCLESVIGQAEVVVYVDSGSTDDSVAMARSLGVEVVELDMSIPFTAARARNAGFDQLLRLDPGVEYVQFVDGDCEVDPGWLERAQQELQDRPEAAAVAGRLRERFPEASIYNRLCDMEWNTPVGEALACGGIALMRAEPVGNAGGFRASLIAGEEPELCARLRAAGWKIYRLDAAMALHDAAMTRFRQWWRRSVRGGYAFANCSHLTRSEPVRLWVRETRSTWFWGLLLPVIVLLGTIALGWPALLLLLAYPVSAWRIYRGRRRHGDTPADARLYAFFCVLGKFPQALGQWRYHWGRLLGRPGVIIEYKQIAGPPGSDKPRRLKVAYLVNQYPHVSHSFIRREILALEAQGVVVERYSVRRTQAKLIDGGDRSERERTQVLLDVGITGLLAALAQTTLCHPLRWLTALRMAVRLGWRSDRGVARHLIYLAEACLLQDRLRHSGPQHLHAHFGTNPAAVALLTRLLGGPSYSFTAHGPEEFDNPVGLSLQEKIEHASLVVAISEYGRSQLFRWCAYADWPKIQVVRCGVDSGYLERGPQPIPDTNMLVCVGRLAEQKGQLRILEALSQLAADGVPFQMTLVGDGPMRGIIEKQIQELGLEKQVRITGWMRNEAVRQEILAARAMVLPSFAEGLPVVLMEAMALGRPVISTYVAGVPELVQDGINGWLIPAGSVAALITALRAALETPPEFLEQMGRAGSERVAAAHDADREAARLGELFQELVFGPAQPENVPPVNAGAAEAVAPS